MKTYLLWFAAGAVLGYLAAPQLAGLPGFKQALTFGASTAV